MYTLDEAYQALGRSYVEPDDGAAKDDAAFAEWLKTLRLRHFAAHEVLRPHNLKVAKRVGITSMRPPIELWGRAGAVLLVCDMIREAVGVSVTLRNLYRSPVYNASVGGAPQSDHVWASGADLDFMKGLFGLGGRGRARVAEGFVRGLHAAHPGLNLAIGVGERTLHVSVLSPRGSRVWGYGPHKGKVVPL